ncbi:MAG: hypothetical protein IPM85_01530 [Chitinophagaceae bacterium]|nr:hypothetical protein [Chitinophagaceae bacterium]
MPETRTAGDNQQVSEVVKLGDTKLLYRLRVDENTLRRRNVNAKPTEYFRKLIEEEKKALRKEAMPQLKNDTLTKKQDDFFNSEFKNEKKETNQDSQKDTEEKETVLSKAKVFEYRPIKFFTDYAVTGFNNNVLVTRFQPYAGGSGPIYLSNNDPFNGMIRMGISDLFEDWKIAGGIRLSPDLNNNEYVITGQYLKRRFDYGFTYYRNVTKYSQPITDPSGIPLTELSSKVYSNLYQATVAYPFDKIRSLRLNVGLRSDKEVLHGNDWVPETLTYPDFKQTYGLAHLEFVHDDAITPL